MLDLWRRAHKFKQKGLDFGVRGSSDVPPAVKESQEVSAAPQRLYYKYTQHRYLRHTQLWQRSRSSTDTATFLQHCVANVRHDYCLFSVCYCSAYGQKSRFQWPWAQLMSKTFWTDESAAVIEPRQRGIHPEIHDSDTVLKNSAYDFAFSSTLFYHYSRLFHTEVSKRSWGLICY